MTRRVRVLIADDHAMFADGIRRLLESEYEVVGSVADGRSLLEQTQTLHPEVVVADVSMPLLNGIEAARQLRAADKRLKIILLTMHDDVTFASRAFEAGVSGYLLKHCASDELLIAMKEVLAGRTYVTPRIAGDLLQVMQRHDGQAQEVHLTQREREILQLLAEGKTMKEVAAILDVSTRTVEFHKYNLMEKTGLHTTAELALYAAKHGIVDL
ncbi:MAG: response regulator transcription factor [Acidobacteria bacterium]|nr:response regulator transcription factor [Acidobacteriota bacterium]